MAERALTEPGLKVCAYANLRRAMRLVGQHYDAQLKPSGLKTTQYTLLTAVSAQGGRSMTELSKLLGMDRTTLTRNLKPLIDKGWIQIDRAKDERLRLVVPTEAGRALLDRATPLWRAAQESLLDRFGEDELGELLLQLTTLADSVNQR